MTVPGALLRGSLTAAAALGLVACSGTNSGTATPAPSPPASTSSRNPDVPRVARPLTVSAYQSDPCETVPPAAMAALRFTAPGEPRVGQSASEKAGPGCAWIGADGLSVLLVLETGNQAAGIGGLTGQYTAKGSGQLGFLEPAPAVDGYPAVYSDLSDRRPKGDCTLVVGIADDLVFSAGTSGFQGQQDSCAAAGQVAAAVLKTLKGA
ncbi:DUF3558 domain-containing protein [Amycolatopsis sp. H20-H5]|uniref:DUF3558 domain-containing protein n=1 Tax=Amycolatopsis sp. H20-H5 TaxID=3046309 RepID=UPI002DB8C721|nr:DUF3558 domain-containing protein [Amycolatopsis sp. H20-H5]MEC3979992.1 DUF3558 domain-containing protein [Amycolatopsis sp. H20-H5]